MMRTNRPGQMDNLAFTVAVSIASRTLILRDRLLKRVKRSSTEDQSISISRQTIASRKQVLDAVFVAPTKISIRAAVLLCHGIGESVDHWIGAQMLLATQGVASLVFDYAGFGKSTGRVQWKQCEEDAIQAFRALKMLLPNTPVSILGFSLGSGIAAAILDRVSPHKLILCSSFTSFQDATRCVGLPRRLSLLAPPIWNTQEALRRCSLPVLVLHCEDDRLFPTKMASSLASGCNGRAKLVIVPNHQHNDPFHRPQRRYWDHVVSVLVSNHEDADDLQAH